MFNFRASLVLLSLSAALAIPAAANASTLFTYTPDGGTPITFGYTAGYSIVGDYTQTQHFTSTSSLDAVFYNSAIGEYDSQLGSGLVDFSIDYINNATGLSFDSILDGPQLYTGSENNNPQFIEGTYVLTSDPFFGEDSVGGTLVIGATPEPSSLFLLGTGALSAAGLVRRRLVKA